jgi:hypothetical protein
MTRQPDGHGTTGLKMLTMRAGQPIFYEKLVGRTGIEFFTRNED